MNSLPFPPSSARSPTHQAQREPPELVSRYDMLFLVFSSLHSLVDLFMCLRVCCPCFTKIPALSHRTLNRQGRVSDSELALHLLLCFSVCFYVCVCEFSFVCFDVMCLCVFSCLCFVVVQSELDTALTALFSCVFCNVC